MDDDPTLLALAPSAEFTAAYRAWRRATVSLAAKLDRACLGDAIDWDETRQESETLSRLHRDLMDTWVRQVDGFPQR